MFFVQILLFKFCCSNSTLWHKFRPEPGLFCKMMDVVDYKKWNKQYKKGKKVNESILTRMDIKVIYFCLSVM